MKELEPGKLHTYNKEQLKRLKDIYSAPSPPLDDINLEWMRVDEDREVVIGSTGLSSLLLDSEIPRREYQQVLHRDSTATVIKGILKKQLALTLETESAEILDPLTDFLYEETTQRGWLEGFEARALNAFLSNQEKFLADAKTKIVINPQIEDGVVRCTVTVSGIGRVKTGNLNIKPLMEVATYESVFSVVYDKENSCYTSTQESFSHAFFNDPQSEPIINTKALALKETISSELNKNEQADSTSTLSKDKKEILEETLNFLASHETPIDEELMDLAEELVKDKYLDDATKTFLTRVRRKVNHSVLALGSETNTLLDKIHSGENVPFSIKYIELIEKSGAAIALGLEDFKMAGDLSQENVDKILTKEIERVSESESFAVARKIFLDLNCVGNLLKNGSNISTDKNSKLRNSLAKKINEASDYFNNADKEIEASANTIQKKDKLVAIEKFLVTLKETKSLLQEIGRSEPRSSSTETDPFLDEVGTYLKAFNSQLPDNVLNEIPTKEENVQRAKMLANALEHVENAKKYLDEVDHKKLSDNSLSMQIAFANEKLRSKNLTFANLQEAHKHLDIALEIEKASPILNLVTKLTAKEPAAKKEPSTKNETPLVETMLYLTEESLKDTVFATLPEKYTVSKDDIQFLPDTKNWKIPFLLSQKNEPIAKLIIKECIRSILPNIESNELNQLADEIYPLTLKEAEAKKFLNLSKSTNRDLRRNFGFILLEDAEGNLKPCRTYQDYWEFVQKLSPEARDYFTNVFDQEVLDIGYYYAREAQKDTLGLVDALTTVKDQPRQYILKPNQDGSAQIILSVTRSFCDDADLPNPNPDIKIARDLYKEYQSVQNSKNYPIETTTVKLDVKSDSGKALLSVTGFAHEMHNQSVYQLSLKFAADNAIRKILAGKDDALDSNDWRAINQICLPYTRLVDGKITMSIPTISENTDGTALFLVRWQQRGTGRVTPLELLEGLRTRKNLPIGPRLDLYGKIERPKLAILKDALKTKKGKEQLAAILENNHSNQHDFVTRNVVTLAYPGLWKNIRYPLRTKRSQDVLNRLPTQALIALLKAASENGDKRQTARLQKIAAARLYKKQAVPLTVAELDNLLSYLPEERAAKFKKTDRYKQRVAAENPKSTDASSAPLTSSAISHAAVIKRTKGTAPPSTNSDENNKENNLAASVADDKKDTPPVAPNEALPTPKHMQFGHGFNPIKK